MLKWADSAEFWKLPQDERDRLFRTPCNEGYTCPTCGRFFAFHSGPPTSGGFMSCFVWGSEGVDYLWHNPDSCCGKGWLHSCLGG